LLGAAGDALGRRQGGEEVLGEVPFQEGGLSGAFEGMDTCGDGQRREERGRGMC